MFCPEQADEGASAEDESMLVNIVGIVTAIFCADVRDDVGDELWREVGRRHGHCAYREESDVGPGGHKSMSALTKRVAGYMYSRRRLISNGMLPRHAGGLFATSRGAWKPGKQRDQTLVYPDTGR